MKPTLVVLAAGMGSRYGGLKQLDPVGPNGENIIDYSIYDAIQTGYGKVVFVIRHDIEESFRVSIGNRYAEKIEIQYAFQELDDLPAGFEVPADREKPWGTGHAILVAKNLINEPFVVINADDFYGRLGFRLLANYYAEAPLEIDGVANFAMTGFILRNTLSEHGTVSRGVCSVDFDGNLEKVVELTKIAKRGDAAENQAEREGGENLTGDEIVSMNMWGFTPAIFDHLEVQFIEFLQEKINMPKSEFFIPFVVDRIINEGVAQVKVLKSTDSWFGVTYREDKPQVMASISQLVDAATYPEKLF